MSEFEGGMEKNQISIVKKFEDKLKKTKTNNFATPSSEGLCLDTKNKEAYFNSFLFVGKL
jgi:hypothetical protein